MSLDFLPEEIEKLPPFEDPVDWLQYGRIPYKIRYNLEESAGELVNRKYPALYRITPDMSPGGTDDESLSIWIWRGIPRDFRNILFYHELKEAEFRFADGLSRNDSHKKAAALHRAYAEKFLSKNRFNEFLKWQSQYKVYRS